jgi:hypothetical protein
MLEVTSMESVSFFVEDDGHEGRNSTASGFNLLSGYN